MLVYGVSALDHPPKLRAPQSGVSENFLEIDVPSDGTCIFYSVAVGTLLPLIQDPKAFFRIFKIMFGEDRFHLATDILNKLRHFNGQASSFAQEGGILFLAILVNEIFRGRVADYMRSNKLISPDRFRSTAYCPDLDNYYNAMARPADWNPHSPKNAMRGGGAELVAISRMLKIHITVYSLIGENQLEKQQPEYGSEFNIHLNLLRVVAHYENEAVVEKYGTYNHFRVLIPPAVFGPALMPISVLEANLGEDNERKSDGKPKLPLVTVAAYQDKLDQLKMAVDNLSRDDEKAIGMKLWRALSTKKAEISSPDINTAVAAAIYCQQQVVNAQQKMAKINHPSLGNVLANLALFIVGLGFMYLIAACIHYKETGRFGFFHKPALASNLSHISQVLQTCARELHPQITERQDYCRPLPDFKQWSPIRI